MQRARGTLTGFSGAPGLVTMYGQALGGENSTTAQVLMDRLSTAINHVVSTFPTAYTFTPDTSVDTLNPVTGALTGSSSVSSTTRTGGASQGYLATMAMVCVTWKTSAFIAGRRLVGRTFFGPVSTEFIDADGTPGSGLLTAAGLTGADWINAGATGVDPVVWHRPVGGSGGSCATIDSYSVRDKYAVLRSRRD